jgi:glucose/arabinose dehydrogenase
MTRAFASCFALFLAAAVDRPASAAIPAGFADEGVASVGSPTALAFTPDGRLLITTQPGSLRIHEDGALLPAPALDLASQLCSQSERGLLGVAVDPAFATNHWIYLYYTFRRGGSCSSPANRVSRFELPDTNVIDVGTELVLIDNIHSTAGNHNGGDVHFGKDDNLYVSVGDGGCDYAGDSGCAGNNDASRDRHVLLGKILRITRDGGIPADNPFVGPGTARCNVTGSTTPGTTCQETFAWGLRNPYRIAFDPDAIDTRFFINDVGQNAWEEIDEGVAGADYGWNCREGAHTNSTTGACAGLPPSAFRDPIHEYGRGGGCASITGGAFVPDGAWPALYEDDYIFADYVCGRMFRLTPNGSGWTASDFGSQLGSLVAMTFGADGALYYATFDRGIRRIRSTADRPPVAQVQANPTSGAAPLNVSFDGSGSFDPDGTPVTEYRWDFGDGSPPNAGPQAVVSHLYAAPGTFTATLRVASGSPTVLSDAVAIPINASNSAPVPEILLPLPAQRFSVGQLVILAGRADDAEDGSLGGESLSWTVLLHHDQHTHPFLGPVGGAQAALNYPAPEDLLAATNSYLEVRLTATDRFGATATVTQSLLPRTVPVTFETAPAGLDVVVNGQALRAPITVTSWSAYALNVDAPSQVDTTGHGFSFASWSDAGSRQHTIVTPPVAASYRATFAPFPGIAVADTSLREGNAGPRDAVFTVSLSAPSTESVVVNFATVDVTAEAGSDYTAVTESLTFAPGETNRTVSISVLGDRVLEANETFRLVLSGPVFGTIVRGEAQGTILNDDAAVDWTGDGKADLVWQEQSAGVVGVWAMDDATAIDARLFLPPQVSVNWRIAAVADFNDDGQADILWQEETLGTPAVTFMDGTTMTSVAFVEPFASSPGRIAAAADFNGDGKPDILWQDHTLGTLTVWFLDGVTRTGSSPLNPGQVPLTWRIAGVGDFNDDGTPDIVWQIGGLIGFWAMDGVTRTSGALFTPGEVPARWKIAAVADYDGDGRPDLILQDETAGFLALRHMNGAQAIDTVPLVPGQTPTNWKVVGPK